MRGEIMKKILLGIISLCSFSVLADYSCTATIKDNGMSRETFTRYSYTQSAACDTARFDCNNFLSDMQSRGYYRNAYCLADRNDYPDYPDYPNPDYPNPYPFPYPNDPRPPARVTCQTDLVDYWGQTIRTFSGNGRSEWEACEESDRFCREALNRGTSNGRNCVRRYGPNPGPGPRPPQDPWITAECRVQRLDPAGWLVQEYTASKSGPRSSNPRYEACREAERRCSYDLRGRQSCRTL